MTALQLGEVHRQDTEYIPDDLSARYRAVRAATEAMAAPLAVEDHVIQTMPDVSPTKWHLGHTSWFFEQFLLVDGPTADPDYEVFHDRFAYLFNSYYVTVGDRHCRIKRGTLSRPTVAEVRDYRAHVDAAMLDLMGRADPDDLRAIVPLVEIGLNHEQQHQELAYTDIKHVFACNPLYPAYRSSDLDAQTAARPEGFVPVAGGLHEVGHDGEGFSYDNERPRHRVYLNDFAISDRLVTNGEWIDFVEGGGYGEARHWLSDGWAAVCGDRANWSHPFYWHRGDDGRWREFTLNGLIDLDPAAPACHLSYFEADAYARWRGCRLPTEFEWEVACRHLASGPSDANFQETGRLHPRPAADGDRQFLGDLWEWTASQYTPYPGYRAPPGALGEYNGKFMCNQFVLRGGSCVTPRSHIRPTYRNFFPPDARWQFTGLRLARDA